MGGTVTLQWDGGGLTLGCGRVVVGNVGGWG